MDEDGEWILSIICAIVPGLQGFLPAAAYIDAALWGGTTNVISNWENIKVDGKMNWGKFWSYAGLGAANGAGVATGNLWIIGATGALQGAGNKFTEHDFKFDTDQIWKEGLYFGLTSVATSYLMLPGKVPGNKPLGSKGLGLGGKITGGLGKLGIEGNAGKYLGNGIANFTTSFATNSGYYGLVTDRTEWKDNWFNISLKMSAISTATQFGVEYSYDKAMGLGFQKAMGDPKIQNLPNYQIDYQINNYYSIPGQYMPSNHYQMISWPRFPNTYSPKTYIFNLPIKK